jgi:hypothetical protein
VPSHSVDGRWIALGILAAYVAFIALMVTLLPVSVGDVLGQLGVPALNQVGAPVLDLHFGDLCNVAAGIENQAAGHAVGDPNPFDPWHRPYIYPSPWLHAQALGFNQNTVGEFAALIIFIFFISTYFLLGKLTPLEGLFTGLFLISPAFITGVERCNIDLVIFPLVVAALALRRVPAASGALILLVSILKIHPIGALLAFLAPPWKKTIPWIAGILGLFILYTLCHLTEFLVIGSLAPRYPLSVLGSDVWGTWLALAGVATGPIGHATTLIIGTLLLFALGCVAVTKAPRLAPEPRWDWEVYSFRLGAGLLLAQFGLGSNNDYGLMFFLFCLPLLFRLRTMAGPIRHWAGAALLLTLIYVNWDFFSDEFTVRHMLLKQPLGWAIMGSLLGLLGATRSWPISWASATVASPTFRSSSLD